ncbi:MAG: hypothetical protein ACFFHD_13815 [Promethearchaeota archaeon]
MKNTNSTNSRNYLNKRMREWFYKPPFAIKKPLIHPPLTNHYPLVGTAFDYLLRFLLQYINPHAVSHPWIAEEGLKVGRQLLKTKIFTSKSEKKYFKVWLKEARMLLERAKDNHAKYLENGTITTELIKSSIHLAKLDFFYRAPDKINVNGTIQDIDPLDVDDLRGLIEGVNLNQFRTEKLCILNPRFTDAAKITGQVADADLILDNTLIDIKTFMNLEFGREVFNQITLYYFLAMIGGVDHAPKDYKIQKIGVYYPRHEYLHVLDIYSIITDKFKEEVLDCINNRNL